MGKKIIGIHSGRRGKMSEQAMQQVLEHTGAKYRVFALTDLTLETCDACLGCLRTHRCVKNDGVNELVAELQDASALVFAALEYWDGVHAKARAFWERVCFMGRSSFFTSFVAVPASVCPGLRTRKSGPSQFPSNIRLYKGVQFQQKTSKFIMIN